MDAAVSPLLVVTLIVMLVGLLGSALPGLPGVPLIFLSALVYAIATGFDVVGGLVIVLLGVFAAIALVADFVATTYGARRFGASSWGTAGGAIGGVGGALPRAPFFRLGSLFRPLLGPIGGGFFGGYLHGRRGDRAGTQGGGA